MSVCVCFLRHEAAHLRACVRQRLSAAAMEAVESAGEVAVCASRAVFAAHPCFRVGGFCFACFVVSGLVLPLELSQVSPVARVRGRRFLCKGTWSRSLGPVREAGDGCLIIG